MRRIDVAVKTLHWSEVRSALLKGGCTGAILREVLGGPLYPRGIPSVRPPLHSIPPPWILPSRSHPRMRGRSSYPSPPVDKPLFEKPVTPPSPVRRVRGHRGRAVLLHPPVRRRRGRGRPGRRRQLGPRRDRRRVRPAQRGLRVGQDRRLGRRLLHLQQRIVEAQLLRRRGGERWLRGVDKFDAWMAPQINLDPDVHYQGP